MLKRDLVSGGSQSPRYRCMSGISVFYKILILPVSLGQNLPFHPQSEPWGDLSHLFQCIPMSSPPTQPCQGEIKDRDREFSEQHQLKIPQFLLIPSPQRRVLLPHLPAPRDSPIPLRVHPGGGLDPSPSRTRAGLCPGETQPTDLQPRRGPRYLLGYL